MSTSQKGRPSSSGAAATAGSASKRRKRRDEGEEEEDNEEQEYDFSEARRRSNGRAPVAAGRAEAAAAGAAGDAAAAAAAAPRSSIPTAAHQALLRFLTVNGRATLAEVEAFFQHTKDHCDKAESKTLPLQKAWDDLNQSIRFMQLEIRRLKSEVDDEEHWVLIDTTDRVAAANAFLASQEDVEMGEDGEERKKNSHAGPAAGSKAMDAAAMAKYLNPSQFSEKQVAFFKVVVSAAKLLTTPSAAEMLIFLVLDFRCAA